MVTEQQMQFVSASLWVIGVFYIAIFRHWPDAAALAQEAMFGSRIYPWMSISQRK
tara:strand:+ start:211 stop:375 length:165 start_codon:yes stop_codon:yes gene_type:complete